MSFVNTIEFIESIMRHRRPHIKGLDHGCVKCLLVGALAMENGERLAILPDGSILPVRAGESALAAKNGARKK